MHMRSGQPRKGQIAVQRLVWFLSPELGLLVPGQDGGRGGCFLAQKALCLSSLEGRAQDHRGFITCGPEEAPPWQVVDSLGGEGGAVRVAGTQATQRTTWLPPLLLGAMGAPRKTGTKSIGVGDDNGCALVLALSPTPSL